MRAWEDFLAQQEKELGKKVVDQWLRPLKIVRFDACNLYLETYDSFKAIWFEEHMRVRVHKELYNNNHKPIKVHLVLATQTQRENIPSIQSTSLSSHMPFVLRFDESPSPMYFEDFLCFAGNLLAYRVVKELSTSETPALQFNPIYLYGPSGSGKTHLMLATAAALKAVGKKTIYVSAELFTEHVVDAIRRAEMQTFRTAYRGVDVLLIDGIEVFARKGATQEEFFHTFNTLHVEGKQIILSAQLPPAELKFIEPRLISRFEWGIVVPLQMLEKEQLRTLLERKAAQLLLSLEETVFEFLLKTFGKNTKSLNRALEALALRSHLKQVPTGRDFLPLKVVERLLKDLIEEEERAALTPSRIMRTVADYYGLRVEDLLSRSQAREYLVPRQLAMHLCRERLQLPYMKIGELFDRDHSTVMAALKQVHKAKAAKKADMLTPLSMISKSLDMGASCSSGGSQIATV